MPHPAASNGPPTGWGTFWVAVSAAVGGGFVAIVGLIGTWRQAVINRTTTIEVRKQDSAEHYVDNLRADLETLGGKVERLSAQVALLERAGLDDKQTIHHLQLKIEQMEYEIARLKDEKAGHESTIALLQTQLAKACAERDELMRRLAQAGVIGGGEPAI